MYTSRIPTVLVAILLVAVAPPYSIIVFEVGAFRVSIVVVSPPSPPAHRRCTSSHHNIRLFANSKNNSGNENGDKKDNDEAVNDPVDVESARKRLELLMGGGDRSNATTEDGDRTAAAAAEAATTRPEFSIKKFLANLPSPPSRELDGIDLPKPPPMSSMERIRRENEIVLLKLLEESDEASNALWNLWYSERGKDGQRRLSDTDMLMGNPQRWEECEALLVNLIDGNRNSNKSTSTDDDECDDNAVDEYIDPRPGIYFVEAVNRLATLYFLQQRLDDSYKLCRIVLQLKPWHFGALSGIVQVCIALGRRDEAREWAELRLPSIFSGSALPGAPMSTPNGPKHPRRIKWCENAVEDAKNLLRLAEKNTKQSLGKPEDYYSDSDQDQDKSSNDEVGNGIGNNMDDDDAWQ